MWYKNHQRSLFSTCIVTMVELKSIGTTRCLSRRRRRSLSDLDTGCPSGVVVGVLYSFDMELGTIYLTRAVVLGGRTYRDVYARANHIYKQEQQKTKRKPYVRSAYFKKDKVFLELFWTHLRQKNWRDRKRRVKYFSCALELLRHTRCDPVSVQNPNRKSEILHRFVGRTQCGEVFIVQVKEDKRSGQKWLMSVFPK